MGRGVTSERQAARGARTPGKIGPVDRVLVIGAAGGVGIHMVQMARLFGATVIVVDVSAAKLAATDEAGAIASIDFTAPDARDALRAAAPAGITVAVDFVGKAETPRAHLDGFDLHANLCVLSADRPCPPFFQSCLVHALHVWSWGTHSATKERYGFFRVCCILLSTLNPVTSPFAEVWPRKEERWRTRRRCSGSHCPWRRELSSLSTRRRSSPMS